MIMKNTQWAWAHDSDSETWFGPYESREEAIAHGKLELFRDPFVVAQCGYPDAEAVVDIGYTHEQLEEWAVDNALFSGDETVFAFTGEQKDAEEELRAWYRKWFKAQSFTVDMSTMEDVS